MEGAGEFYDGDRDHDHGGASATPGDTSSSVGPANKTSEGGAACAGAGGGEDTTSGATDTSKEDEGGKSEGEITQFEHFSQLKKIPLLVTLSGTSSSYFIYFIINILGHPTS